MIRVGRKGLQSGPSAGECRTLTKNFREHNVIRLPRFFSRELRDQLAREFAGAASKRVRDAGGSESELCDSPVTAAVIFLLNERRLLDAVERVTGLKRLRAFVGRVYRLEPAHRDAMGWHSDALKKRRVALSINLGAKRYTGGTLEFRDARTKRPLGSAPNRGFGNAVLFRVTRMIEHRVTPVTGRHPKIAFAGWFTS